jgi:hypothetical protein
MRKARKILALATGVAALGAALPALRPLTGPDGRPACGNVVTKGPKPPRPPKPPGSA